MAILYLDDGVEHRGKVLVGVAIPGVDAAVLVIKLHGTGDGLGEGEARGGGLVGGQGIPLLLGDVLGHQRMLRLDCGELSHGQRGLEA